MLDVSAQQDAEFREDEPSIFVFNFGCQGTQVPNFVFETPGWHKLQPKSSCRSSDNSGHRVFWVWNCLPQAILMAV